MGKAAVLRADRFIEDLSGDCCMNYSFFIIPCLLFTVVSEEKNKPQTSSIGARLEKARGCFVVLMTDKQF